MVGIDWGGAEAIGYFGVVGGRVANGTGGGGADGSGRVGGERDTDVPRCDGRVVVEIRSARAGVTRRVCPQSRTVTRLVRLASGEMRRGETECGAPGVGAAGEASRGTGAHVHVAHAECGPASSGGGQPQRGRTARDDLGLALHAVRHRTRRTRRAVYRISAAVCVWRGAAAGGGVVWRDVTRGRDADGGRRAGGVRLVYLDWHERGGRAGGEFHPPRAASWRKDGGDQRRAHTNYADSGLAIAWKSGRDTSRSCPADVLDLSGPTGWCALAKTEATRPARRASPTARSGRGGGFRRSGGWPWIYSTYRNAGRRRWRRGVRGIGGWTSRRRSGGRHRDRRRSG